MLPTKKNLISISIFPFLISIGLYYLFFVWIQKSSGNYCKTHYCLDILPISDFVSITIGIIGVIALIISLDAWKIQEKFKSETEFFTDLIDNLELFLEQITYTHPNSCNEYNDFLNTLKIYWRCVEKFNQKDLGFKLDIESLGEFIYYCIDSNQDKLEYFESFDIKKSKLKRDIEDVIDRIKALKVNV